MSKGWSLRLRFYLAEAPEPECQDDKDDSEHHCISPDPDDNRKSSRARKYDNENAEESGNHAHKNQQHLVGYDFTKTDAGHDFKHTGQDGPEGNQVKQKHGGNPRPHESHKSSDDSDNALNQEGPMVAWCFHS